MTSTSFYFNERPPNWVFWGKALPSDQSGPHAEIIPTGNLGSKGQEQLIHALLREEVGHQMWPALDQNRIALPNVANGLNDRAGIERTSTLYRRNLNPGWQIILVNPMLSVLSRHDKHRNLARLKNSLLKVDRPSSADNDVQRWI